MSLSQPRRKYKKYSPRLNGHSVNILKSIDDLERWLSTYCKNEVPRLFVYPHDEPWYKDPIHVMKLQALNNIAWVHIPFYSVRWIENEIKKWEELKRKFTK